jgi:hypothetical protein
MFSPLTLPSGLSAHIRVYPSSVSPVGAVYLDSLSSLLTLLVLHQQNVGVLYEAGERSIAA